MLLIEVRKGKAPRVKKTEGALRVWNYVAMLTLSLRDKLDHVDDGRNTVESLGGRQNL